MGHFLCHYTSSKEIQNNWKAEKLKKNMIYISVITVPADGLALLGARTSASTVMTELGTC